ncbi:MAG TPA: hypothetical protein DCZ03_10610 [Gammaproteobacteria bacterium]|nr:hypothetical protein [Gammaproteobacteria bacterium]
MKKLGAVIGFCLLSVATFAQAEEDGKKIYESACFACHNSGIAGAPKLGDAEQWGSRLEKGVATIKQNAIKGFSGSTGFMPAKGGRADLSDAAVEAAVDYMLSQSITSE